MINNEIIVIGGEHYNSLGVIRSLGESGINPIFILISNEKYNSTAHSKYIKRLIRIKSDDCNDVLDILDKEFNNLKEKPILIPTGDPIAKALDRNYKKLSKKYILPNINNEQGKIELYMDKKYQEKLCNKFGIKCAKSWVVELSKINNYVNKFPNKVILKPYLSADGKKSDIIILEGNENIIDGLKIFKEKGYKKVMVQEFIEYESEYCLMGMVFNDKLIIPGINNKIYTYPNNRGSSSFSEMMPIKDFPLDISSIKEMVCSLNYTGLFEIEIFKVNDEIYFNEMNLRNSANQYAYVGNEIPYIYLYINLILGNDLSEIKKEIDKHYYFCIEPLYLKNVFEGVVPFSVFLKNIFKSTKLIYNKKDKRPFFIRMKNSLCLKVKKIIHLK